MVAERPDDGYEAAKHLAGTHDCPDCGHRSKLEVRWFKGAYQCWCPRCRREDGFRRRESLTARWKRDPESVPVEIANKLEVKHGGQAMSETALALADEKQMVQRIEQARWLAELQPKDRQSLAHLSLKYGLDPLMKELTLYEGSPYISVAGLIRIAHRQSTFAGIEDRPMTQAERQQYGYKAPFCWLVKVYRSDWKVPAVGTGTGDPGAPLRNNPVERVRPEWMARARALRQALKLAYPHSLPFDEVQTAEEQGIDPETGEIVDGPRVVSVRVIPANGGEGAVIEGERGEIVGEPADGIQEGSFLDEPDAEPVDAEDAPVPTALDEAQLRAEARRAELRQGLEHIAAKSKRGWPGFLEWWQTQYKTPFEQASVAELEEASLLLNPAPRKAS